VTDVRVERLQDISEADAAAEGLIRLRSGRYVVHKGEQYAGLARHTARARFGDLWSDINEPESWQANPFVAAVTFSVHARNIDQLAPIAEAAE
jgi:isocitrate lyase